jgi:hypothetical protein
MFPIISRCYVDGTLSLFCLECNKARSGTCSLKADRDQCIQAAVSTLVESMSASGDYVLKVKDQKSSGNIPTWGHIMDLARLQEKVHHPVLLLLKEYHLKALEPACEMVSEGKPNTDTSPL